MARLRGGVGQSTERVFEAEGGLQLQEFRSEEGIFPTVDLGRFVASELYCQAVRTFDTGAVSQSTTKTETIEDLPPTAILLGIFINTDQPTRLTNTKVDLQNVGEAGAAVDWPLWLWLNGDDTYGNSTWQIGDAALGYVMSPPEQQAFWRHVGGPVVLTNMASLPGREGGASVRITCTTTGFGAGTARVTGHLVIGFHRRENEYFPMLP